MELLDKQAARITLTVILVCAAVAALVVIRQVVVLFIIAVLIAYLVSPLVAQNPGRSPDDGSALWIGLAALLVLGGSAVLLLAERRR